MYPNCHQPSLKGDDAQKRREQKKGKSSKLEARPRLQFTDKLAKVYTVQRNSNC